MAHIIRLRGPWHYEIVAGGSPHQAHTGRVQMPTDWSGTLGRDFRGRVKCIRHFGMPAGLDRQSIVILVVGSVEAAGQITLNGEPLGGPGIDDNRFDIGDLLTSRNELCIELALPCQGSVCNAHLEISSRT